MVELEAVADPVRLSYLKAILEREGLRCFVFDGNGALGPACPSRLMVTASDAPRARAALAAADPQEVWR